MSRHARHPSVERNISTTYANFKRSSMPAGKPEFPDAPIVSSTAIGGIVEVRQRDAINTYMDHTSFAPIVRLSRSRVQLIILQDFRQMKTERLTIRQPTLKQRVYPLQHLRVLVLLEGVLDRSVEARLFAK